MPKRPALHPRDFNGERLRIGDSVRRARRGSDVIHWKRRATLPVERIVGIGTHEHMLGLIQVSGSVAWESPKNFEKVTR